ncbi:beta strand repeat-containing protein, partial [Roseivirga sp.]|uniref:beta strand repeat-containing protein n=1 Tax=Roseivirga sp. TaxID=1964215 RepID=UPI003B8C617E
MSGFWSNINAQTIITTISTTSSGATPSSYTATSPSNTGNDIDADEVFTVNYGQGNNISVTSYTVSGIGTAFSNFLRPDTLVLNRRVVSDRLVNIWYVLEAGNEISDNAGTIGDPDIVNMDADQVSDADAIYLSGTLNNGYDNILVNVDDLAQGSIQVETERVDIIWYSGIQTSEPDNAVFPIIERGGNDNIAVAAITSINPDGSPASYGTLIGIPETFWPGGTNGVSFDDYLILRRETAGSDPLPLLNIGELVAGQSAQLVQGVAISFAELGISANQSIFGYSIFPADVVDGFSTGTNNVLTTGNQAIASSITLTDISTFPADTESGDSGLDLVAGVSAAVANDDNLIETIGPGGYKSNNVLRTWLKANDGAFVSDGGAASTEGGSVGFWEDQSVADNNFTTLTTAPTFRSSTSSINFNPTVDFLTGSDTGLQIPDSDDYNINGPFTRKSINIAFRTSTTDIATRQQIFEEGGGGNGLGIYIDGGTLYGAIWNRNNGTSAGAPWNDGTPTSFVSTSVDIDTEYILTLEFDGSTDFTGTVTLFLNGQSFGSLSSVGLLYNHGNDIGLGDQDGGSRYHNNTTDADSYQGEIAEFIYCNDPAALTTAGRNRIESYLAIKYGITLDQSTPINYVNSAGDIIFNTTSSAAIGGYLEYNNDIAGIGRDDDSELDQPASRSENTGSLVTIDRGASISTDDTWLIWGNDGGALTESSSVTSPSTIDTRLERVWRVAEENEVLTTSVSFDITGLGLSTNQDDFSLLVASNSSNGDFSNATVLTGGTLVGNTLTFTGVDLEDGEYFTLGTAFFFCTPGNYNDEIIMWLRADEGVTTATEGANVTIWDDQTPSNNDAEDLTAPVYRATTNLINFNPTIDFSTASTGLFIDNVGGFNVDESTSKKFTIAFRTGDDITTQQVIYEQGGATRGINLYIQSGVLHLSAWNQGAGDGIGAPWNTAGAIATVNTSSIAINTDYIVTFDYAGNDDITGIVTGYLNGASFGTPLSNIGRLYGHTDPIGLGDENSASRYGDGTTSGAASFDGFISEMSYYNDPSSYLAADRNRIESSMAIKYGITLDQTVATDFTASDGTAVWDASVNPGYDVNIAGIGRDDDACLEQKQSRSGNDDAIVTVGLGEIAATNDANSNSFDDDGDFFTWGSDGASTDFANITTAGTPGTVTDRMLRVWKAQDTGDVGATDISFDLTSLLGYSGNAGDYQLIIANGGDNTSLENGTTIAGGTFNGNVLTFSGVNLTDGQFFTLGVASEFCAPGGVTGSMVLWLRPDQGTSTLVDNTTLTTWTDQSTATNNATDDGNPPLYRDNTTDNINFQPTMEFDGTNDRLNLGDLSEIKSTSGSGEYSMFGIGLRESISTNENYILGSLGGSSNQDLHFGYRNSTSATIAHWGNDQDVTVNAVNSPSAPFLVGATYTSGDRVIEEVRSDDFNRATDATTTAISGTRTNFVGDLVSVNNYAGFISAVLVYNREVTDLEKLQIYSYFAIKYGITLPQDNDNDATLNEVISGSVAEGDLVASDESIIIWDESNGYSTYHNGMAGIGRDDAACLNQKQSTSASDGTILTIGLDAVATNNASNSGVHDNLDFLVWGHDGVATDQATAAGDLSDLPTTISERMRRVWRVEDTGTVGETEIQFDLTGLGYSSDAADFRLIIADAGSGGTMAGGTLVAGGTFNGDVLSFSGINLTDGQYFTLGTALETCGPGGVNSNIALWLRGDLEAFSDAGSTAATDGDNVLQWNDQSSPADNGSE